MKEVITAIGDHTVESSLGWRVDILSVNSIQYQEKDKTITFEIEDYPDFTGELEWTIYIPPKCTWQGRIHNEETINQEKLDEIIDRISTAFWKLDMKIKEIA
jgi:hypothetical protein